MLVNLLSLKHGVMTSLVLNKIYLDYVVWYLIENRHPTERYGLVSKTTISKATVTMVVPILSYFRQDARAEVSHRTGKIDILPSTDVRTAAHLELTLVLGFWSITSFRRVSIRHVKNRVLNHVTQLEIFRTFISH